MLTAIKNTFHLSPWKWSLRARIIWAAIFFRTKQQSRYSLNDIIQNILDTDLLKRTELVNASLCNDRFEVLRSAVEACKGTEGIFAEFGVYQGRTLEHIARLSGPHRKVVGFDSFEGLPEAWGSLLPKGAFKTSIPDFKHFHHVSLEIGLIEETLPRYTQKNKTSFALVHIDCDLYKTTRYILLHVIPLLSDGGIIIFDEYYGYPTWKEHEYKAWKEVLCELNLVATAIYYSNKSCAFRIEKGVAQLKFQQDL